MSWPSISHLPRPLPPFSLLPCRSACSRPWGSRGCVLGKLLPLLFTTKEAVGDGGFLKVVGALEQPSLELCIRAGKAVDPYNYTPSQTRILPFTESPPGPRGAPVDVAHTSPAACVSVFVPSPARGQWQQHSVDSRRTQRSWGGGGCTNSLKPLVQETLRANSGLHLGCPRPGARIKSRVTLGKPGPRGPHVKQSNRLPWSFGWGRRLFLQALYSYMCAFTEASH